MIDKVKGQIIIIVEDLVIRYSNSYSRDVLMTCSDNIDIIKGGGTVFKYYESPAL